MNKSKIYYNGSEWKNKVGSVAKIIDVGLKKYSYFVLVNDNYITEMSCSRLRKGNFKDYFYPSVQGIGYLGGNKYLGKKYKPIYDKWYDMLSRCYGYASYSTHLTYKDIKVCNEWLNYQKFAKWILQNKFTNEVIDKDLLFKDNKIYSPETCCLISSKLNIILSSIKNKKGYAFYEKLNKWGSFINIKGKLKYLGVFDSKNKARECYLKYRKIENIRILNEWKDKLTPRLYKALQERLNETLEE